MRASPRKGLSNEENDKKAHFFFGTFFCVFGLLTGCGSLRLSKVNEVLSKNIQAYNTLADYLLTVGESNEGEDYICLGIDGCSKDDIVLSQVWKNGESLEISEEISSALALMKNAFSDMGYALDAVRIRNGSTVSFDTIDGVYSLVYSEESIGDIGKIYPNCKIYHGEADWFHKLKK